MSDFSLVVLVSGRGSNLQAILKAIDQDLIPARITAVFSDQQAAKALNFARERGIEAHWVDPRSFQNKADYERNLMERIQVFHPNCIVLAGFMRVLSPWFVRNVACPIINIHPSLLPAFPGLDAQQQALEAGVRFSGCTVHFVNEGVDTGPIIMQRVVPVLSSDTVETLADRILQEEHRLFPKVVEWIARGLISVEAGKVIIPEEAFH